MVKDRFDCDCARALKALLAWWLPDRSIVYVCVCGGVEMVSRGRRRKKEDWRKTARQAQVCPARLDNWRAYDVFINVRDVNGNWQQ